MTGGASPVVWLKTADQILAKAVRKRSAIAESRHQGPHVKQLTATCRLGAIHAPPPIWRQLWTRMPPVTVEVEVVHRDNPREARLPLDGPVRRRPIRDDQASRATAAPVAADS